MTGPGATGKTGITPVQVAGMSLSGGLLFGVCLVLYTKYPFRNCHTYAECKAPGQLIWPPLFTTVGMIIGGSMIVTAVWGAVAAWRRNRRKGAVE